jgi:hypothetical protein
MADWHIVRCTTCGIALFGEGPTHGLAVLCPACRGDSREQRAHETRQAIVTVCGGLFLVAPVLLISVTLEFYKGSGAYVDPVGLLAFFCGAFGWTLIPPAFAVCLAVPHRRYAAVLFVVVLGAAGVQVRLTYTVLHHLFR